MVPSTFYRFLYLAAQTCCPLFKPCYKILGEKETFLLFEATAPSCSVCQEGVPRVTRLNILFGGVSSFSKNLYIIYLAEKAECIVWKVFHLFQFNLN